MFTPEIEKKIGYFVTGMEKLKDSGEFIDQARIMRIGIRVR